MSDSEKTENGEFSDEASIKEFSVDRVIDVIESAVKEIENQEDYVSYSTLLDIHLGDPLKFSEDDRTRVLDALLKVMTNDKELVYNIGWDLPDLIVSYISLEDDFQGPIRDSPSIYKAIKIFECLALSGNAKELFLKSCELLTSIDIDDCQCDSMESREKIFDIKLYCIYELIESCLKKIKTIHPSRLLSMATYSYMNLVHKNMDRIDNMNFILKRVYTFVKSYNMPPLPERESIDYSEDELEKILDEEKYLQRKLLTSFLTQAVFVSGPKYLNGYSLELLAKLQREKQKPLKFMVHFKSESIVFDRLTELAYSLDINLREQFDLFLEESREIFDSFDHEKSEDELYGDLIESITTEFQDSISHSLLADSKNGLNMSLRGCIMIYTHSVVFKDLLEKTNVEFKDAVMITLRMMVPEMVHSKFRRTFYRDISMFWSWLAVYKLAKSKKPIEVSAVPKCLLNLYLRVLLHACITSPQLPAMRYNMMTLITKVLFHSPQETAFTFLTDTLENCPYDNIKSALVKILKEFVSRFDPGDIDDKVAKLNINKDEKSAGDSNDYSVTLLCLSYKFIMNEERFKVIMSLIRKSKEETFFMDTENDDTITDIDNTKAITLLSYLNLLIAVKKHPFFVEKKDTTSSLINEISEKISKVKESTSKSFYEQRNSKLNTLDMLSIALDRLHEK